MAYCRLLYGHIMYVMLTNTNLILTFHIQSAQIWGTKTITPTFLFKVKTSQNSSCKSFYITFRNLISDNLTMWGTYGSSLRALCIDSWFPDVAYWVNYRAGCIGIIMPVFAIADMAWFCRVKWSSQSTGWYSLYAALLSRTFHGLFLLLLPVYLFY